MKAIEHKMGNIIVLLFKATVISTSSVVSIVLIISKRLKESRTEKKTHREEQV